MSKYRIAMALPFRLERTYWSLLCQPKLIPLVCEVAVHLPVFCRRQEGYASSCAIPTARFIFGLACGMELVLCGSANIVRGETSDELGGANRSVGGRRSALPASPGRVARGDRNLAAKTAGCASARARPGHRLRRVADYRSQGARRARRRGLADAQAGGRHFRRRPRRKAVREAHLLFGGHGGARSKAAQ